MIVYFANRTMDIIGHASTNLRNGFEIVDDLKTEEIETGVATFECEIAFNKSTRLQLEEMTNAGNYVLRSANGENEFYTIIESEIDTKAQTILVYAEDAGLDLLNEVVGDYEATETHTAEWYVNKFSADSGFEIGINEIPVDRTRKLSWDGESTATERLASIATQFGGFEVSYSFDIERMEVTHKYINIYDKRGKDIGEKLRLNKEIDRIVTKKSVANLATAFKCTGGTPENADKPITLKGYEYDDGDFYVDGVYLKSRNALEKWSRYQWEKLKPEGYQGHIIKQYSYDTTSQKTLCSHALTELKKICDMEINYEVDINKLPDNVKIGDRIDIIDDAGELYLSTRILLLQASETRQSHTATLGEHLIKSSGISVEIQELASQFAAEAAQRENAKLLEIATAAMNTANDAAAQVEDAMESVADANEAVKDAVESIEAAKKAAQDANAAAEAAQGLVDEVDEKISGLETTITNAHDAAEQAAQAAATAQAQANEAHSSAVTAQAQAKQATEKATQAETAAKDAEEKAETASSTAATAKEQAEAAATKAEAVRLDAEQAKADIVEFENQLTTWSEMLEVDYARKTELTAAQESLQVQITKNAAGITENYSKLTVIDETVSDVAELAQQAQDTAQQAQDEADAAKTAAQTAQDKADAAAANAKTAQDEADNAKEAAQTAQGVADKAAEDLAAAEQELATVQGRVDATAEEIAAAQEAVNAAQSAADKAQEDAVTAAEKATTAQNKANEAAQTATNAQTAANEAQRQAAAAQQAANNAHSEAQAAQNKANEAAAAATAAQNAANTAKDNAQAAQAQADKAVADALAAQQAADTADDKAAQAAADLETAKQNLANVTGRVDATEEEIEQAKKDVETAQAAAEAADAEAKAAQSAADKAKADAATAQAAATNAKNAADKAQADANAAKAAADKAQADVNALSITVTEQGTEISKKADKIELDAYKNEVTTTLGGYYTKEQADANLSVSANNVLSTVSNTYTTIADFNKLTIGGRNLLPDTKAFGSVSGHATVQSETYNGLTVRYLDMTSYGTASYKEFAQWNNAIKAEAGAQYTFSFYAKGSGKIRCHFYSGGFKPVKCVSSTGVSNTASDGNVDITLTNEWQRYWVTYTLEATNTQSSTANKNVLLRLWGGNKAYVCGVMFEKASKASDWAPAPEDMATVTQLSTAIDQTEKKIALRAQEITDLGTRATSLEVRANGFDVSIANAAKTATNFMSYDATNGLLVGNKTSGSWAGTRAQMTSSAYNVLDASGVALASFGATATVGKANGRNVYIDSDSVDIRNGTAVLASFGTTTTIGPTSAQHVLIDSDSVDIKNGTAINASFSANEISLANNNKSAHIYMCGKEADIHVKQIESNDFFSIESDNVRLEGTGNVHMESCADTTGEKFASFKANSYSSSSGGGATASIVAATPIGSGAVGYARIDLESYTTSNPYAKIRVVDGSQGTIDEISIVPSKITLDSTDTDVTGKLTATGEIFAESNIRVNSKTVNDTKEGVFIAKAGYMQIQRASSNPYIDFVYGTGASSCGRIGVNSSKYMEFTNASRYTFSSAPYVNSMKMAAVCSGYADPGAIAANTYVDKTITFPFTFESTPNVVACLFSSATSSTFGGFAISVVSRTTTGATIRIFNNTGTQRSPDIFWIATQN